MENKGNKKWKYKRKQQEQQQQGTFGHFSFHLPCFVACTTCYVLPATICSKCNAISAEL